MKYEGLRQSDIKLSQFKGKVKVNRQLDVNNSMQNWTCDTTVQCQAPNL